jgi:hypothetical protein
LEERPCIHVRGIDHSWSRYCCTTPSAPRPNENAIVQKPFMPPTVRDGSRGIDERPTADEQVAGPGSHLPTELGGFASGQGVDVAGGDVP